MRWSRENLPERCLLSKKGLSVDVPIFSLKPSLGKWLVNHGKSHYIAQFVYSIGHIS